MNYFEQANEIKQQIKDSISNSKSLPSLVLINTGNGKGKTTAAIGTIIRACGYHQTCAFYQFLKGNVDSGEISVLKGLGVKCSKTKCPCAWDIKDKNLALIECQTLFNYAKLDLMSGAYNLIVLDEITYLIEMGFISIDDLIFSIQNRHSNTSIIITGRHAPNELIAIADTVSEIMNIKHAFENNALALKGIDF